MRRAAPAIPSVGAVPLLPGQLRRSASAGTQRNAPRDISLQFNNGVVSTEPPATADSAARLAPLAPLLPTNNGTLSGAELSFLEGDDDWDVERYVQQYAADAELLGRIDAVTGEVMTEATLRQRRALLRRYCSEKEVAALLVDRPALLAAPLECWAPFLTGYGLSEAAVRKLLRDSLQLFLAASVHDAGRAILFFKSHGWSDASIISRLIPNYPHLLALDIERDVGKVLNYLEQRGCCGDSLRLLLWECPRILAVKDFERHVRAFQFLGVYGLRR